MKTVATIAILILMAFLVVLAIGFTISTLRPPPEPTLEEKLIEIMGPTDPALIEAEDAFMERMGPSAAPEAIVAEFVKDVRATTDFPVMGSEHETWTGIRGSGRTIIYTYDAVNLENIPYDETSLKGMMTWMLCGDPFVEYIHRAGVVMAYEYSNLDTGGEFTVSVTDRDCEVR